MNAEDVVSLREAMRNKLAATKQLCTELAGTEEGVEGPAYQIALNFHDWLDRVLFYHEEMPNFREYQIRAHCTAQYPNLRELFQRVAERGGYIVQVAAGTLGGTPDAMINPYYPALGLAGEVGEFCNKLKKVMRDSGGVITESFRQDAKKELGDILWYLSELATVFGMDFGAIAEENLNKLASRKERGTITGSGDNR